MKPFRAHARGLLYSLCHLASGSVASCLTGVRHFDVPDMERLGAVLLAGNHQSFLDPVLVGMALSEPVHYLARSGLFRVPGFGQLIRALGAHPVRRGMPDAEAIRWVHQVLRDGEPLLMFPEGTRTRDGSLGRFRPGVGSVAVRCDVPVIPVCIHGAFESWPRTHALPRPARVAVAFGPPLRAKDGDEQDLTRRLAERVAHMQKALRRHLGRPQATRENDSQERTNN